MNSYYHAKSCAKKWGGTPEDYIEIHEFIDSSKRIIGDVRHRSLYHHTEGIWLCQRIFGRTITIGGSFGKETECPGTLDGEHEWVAIYQETRLYRCGVCSKQEAFSVPREVPVRLIAELHVEQDLGWIPSPSDYIRNMELNQWMGGAVRKEQPLSHVFPKGK